MTLQTRVFILTEYPLEAACITSVLSGKAAIEVCGSGRVSPISSDAIARAEPDVVVMSISILSKETDDFLRQNNSFKVVTIVPDEKPIWGIRAVKAGAAGCVGTRDASDLLVEAIGRAASGGTFLTREVEMLVLADFTSTADRQGVAALSQRELEVYDLLGRGLTTVVIAGQMELSLKTVQAYAARIKTKLDLPNHSHLLRSAMSWEMSTAGGK